MRQLMERKKGMFKEESAAKRSARTKAATAERIRKCLEPAEAEPRPMKLWVWDNGSGELPGGGIDVRDRGLTKRLKELIGGPEVLNEVFGAVPDTQPFTWEPTYHILCAEEWKNLDNLLFAIYGKYGSNKGVSIPRYVALGVILQKLRGVAVNWTLCKGLTEKLQDGHARRFKRQSLAVRRECPPSTTPHQVEPEQEAELQPEHEDDPMPTHALPGATPNESISPTAQSGVQVRIAAATSLRLQLQVVLEGLISQKLALEAERTSMDAATKSCKSKFSQICIQLVDVGFRKLELRKKTAEQRAKYAQAEQLSLRGEVLMLAENVMSDMVSSADDTPAIHEQKVAALQKHEMDVAWATASEVQAGEVVRHLTTNPTTLRPKWMAAPSETSTFKIYVHPCPVCMRGYAYNEQVQLSCGHSYHDFCLGMVLERHSVCVVPGCGQAPHPRWLQAKGYPVEDESKEETEQSQFWRGHYDPSNARQREALIAADIPPPTVYPLWQPGMHWSLPTMWSAMNDARWEQRPGAFDSLPAASPIPRGTHFRNLAQTQVVYGTPSEKGSTARTYLLTPLGNKASFEGPLKCDTPFFVPSSVEKLEPGLLFQVHDTLQVTAGPSVIVGASQAAEAIQMDEQLALASVGDSQAAQAIQVDEPLEPVHAAHMALRSSELRTDAEDPGHKITVHNKTKGKLDAPCVEKAPPLTQLDGSAKEPEVKGPKKRAAGPSTRRKLALDPPRLSTEQCAGVTVTAQPAPSLGLDGLDKQDNDVMTHNGLVQQSECSGSLATSKKRKLAASPAGGLQRGVVGLERGDHYMVAAARRNEENVKFYLVQCTAAPHILATETKDKWCKYKFKPGDEVVTGRYLVQQHKNGRVYALAGLHNGPAVLKTSYVLACKFEVKEAQRRGRQQLFTISAETLSALNALVDAERAK